MSRRLNPVDRTPEESQTTTREMVRNVAFAAKRANLLTVERLVLLNIALYGDDHGVAFPTPREIADLTFKRAAPRAITKVCAIVRRLAAIEIEAFGTQGRRKPPPHPPRSALLFYAEPTTDKGLPSPKIWTDRHTKQRFERGDAMPDDHWLFAIPAAAVSPDAFHRYAVNHRSSERRFQFVGEGLGAWADWTPPPSHVNDNSAALDATETAVITAPRARRASLRSP